jgi:hypothetical protein
MSMVGLRYGLMLAEEDGAAERRRHGGHAQRAHESTRRRSPTATTNQTALDTLLKAQLQVSLSYFELSGYVLHPIDWFQHPEAQGHDRALPVR